MANYQVVVLLGESGSFDEEPHDRSRHFGIGKDADDGFFVFRNQVSLFLRGICRGNRNIRHQGFDLVFDPIDVDIADYDDRLVFRAIPRFVEVVQGFMVETLQTVQIADYVAVLVFRASVDGGVASYHGAPSSRVRSSSMITPRSLLIS